MNKAIFKFITISSITALSIFCDCATAETIDSPEIAGQKGITLFNQYKNGEQELRIAAESGDIEAQYYLGEEIRQYKHFITPEAHKWLTSAADHGELYAMLRLSQEDADLCAKMQNCPSGEKSPSEWLNELMAEGTKKAAAGDSEAMYVLYLATADLTWLEKSANSGYAISEWLLANRYKEHQGTFFPPWKRSDTIKQLLKSSAEGGYPQGMVEYGAILYEEKDFDGYRHWNEMAADKGDADAILGLGMNFSGVSENHKFPEDLVKAYGYLSILTELTGGGGIQDSVSYVMPQVIKKMTPEQIVEGNKFATEWKSNHPPLSFFPPKLQY